MTPARAASLKKYNRSAKHRAAQARYRQTIKGILARERGQIALNVKHRGNP